MRTSADDAVVIDHGSVVDDARFFEPRKRRDDRAGRDETSRDQFRTLRHDRPRMHYARKAMTTVLCPREKLEPDQAIAQGEVQAPFGSRHRDFRHRNPKSAEDLAQTAGIAVSHIDQAPWRSASQQGIDHYLRMSASANNRYLFRHFGHYSAPIQALPQPTAYTNMLAGRKLGTLP